MLSGSYLMSKMNCFHLICVIQLNKLSFSVFTFKWFNALFPMNCSNRQLIGEFRRTEFFFLEMSLLKYLKKNFAFFSFMLYKEKVFGLTNVERITFSRILVQCVLNFLMKLRYLKDCFAFAFLFFVLFSWAEVLFLLNLLNYKCPLFNLERILNVSFYIKVM